MSNESVHPSTSIVQEIASLINKNEFDQGLIHLTQSLTETQLFQNTWDLSTYLFELLEKPSDKLCNEYQIFAQDALTHLAKHGNPRELLIIMLEQSDRFVSNEIFIFHINLFSILIPRLPLKASLKSSVRDILSILRCHLTTLPLPTINQDFSGKDLLIFNHDRRIVRLLDLTQFYTNFICQLRDYFNSASANEFLEILGENLICLLKDPLIALSYEPIDNVESASFAAVRPVLDCLFTIHRNPLQTIDSKDEKNSVFIYLLLTKSDYFTRLPCVYSRQFYLFLSVKSIEFFSQDRERVMFTEKAANLVSAVCSKLLALKEFDETILDNDEFHRLIDLLKVLMVQSPARQYAPLTIGAYRSLFQSLDRRARSIFLRQQLTKSSSAEDSYRTFLCTLVKDEFFHDYRMESSQIYKGAFLFEILDQLCRLPNGVESDLLEIYDCLCTTLNFIRFIGLSDNSSINRTRFWTDRLRKINENFLKPLRQSIDIARAHYRLELKNRRHNPIEKIDTELMVDDKPLEMPSKNEQLQSLENALTKFDILDCILSSLNNTFVGHI